VFVNLTPHPVTIYDDGEIILTVPPSGTIARIAEAPETIGSIDDIPITMVTLGELQGLPERQSGTFYVVSMPALMAALATGLDRPDLLYPYGQVRDAGGRILGCRSLARLSAPATDAPSTPHDYGPHTDAVAALIDRARRLTGTEIERLADAHPEDLRETRDVVWDACDGDIQTRYAGAAREDAGRAAWDATWLIAGPVTDAPGDYQRRADAYGDIAARAKVAAANAALATATADIIPAATAEALTAQWRRAIPADLA
jgi:hypothetical protein